MLTNSLFQRFALDFWHHALLCCRCQLYEWRSQEICEYILIMNNEELLGLCLLLMIICLSCILAWFYGNEVVHHIRTILITMWAVEFLARSVDFIQVDILTVYLFVWQFMFITWKWQAHQLFAPVVIIEQGSFCLFLAVLSFIMYDAFYRYIPFKISLLWFWFASVVDIFLVLHPNGWLRYLVSNYKFLKSKQFDPHNRYEADNTISHQSTAPSYFCKLFTKCAAIESEGDYFPLCYYPKGTGNCDSHIGFGDFLVYNILLLLVLSLFSSTETKIWVAFGFIVSIIIGLLGTFYLGQIWDSDCVPGLPLPVICFSTYVLFLDVIMGSSEECIYL